jgi:quinol monooxygenase YgiN
MPDQENTMPKTALFIASKARPGKRDEIFELYEKMMVPHAEANEKQEIVVWCADQKDPDAFHLFEIYSDSQSFEANARSKFFTEYMEAVGPLLAVEPTVGMATPQWTKGL